MAQDRALPEIAPAPGLADPGPPPEPGPWRRYGLRLARRRLLWRALRARHGLQVVADRTAGIGRDEVLLFACLRNEALRLPHFLRHYRALGVTRFLFVDNDSDDGTAGLLADAPDISAWRATGRYRAARFGMDWLGWLLWRHGSGRWCLTVDADELLVWPGCEAEGLAGLTARLDGAGRRAMGALMLDLYPRGPLDAAPLPAPDEDPVDRLGWFDPGPYRARWQARHANLWLQGGMRERVFFADRPARGPTLNKIPLVRWHWRYAYLNSTHALLPARLNGAYRGPAGPGPSGVLLHTKFLPDSTARAAQERGRGQHFARPDAYEGYYRALEAGPTAWAPGACRYEGPDQLERLGLMRRG